MARLWIFSKDVMPRTEKYKRLYVRDMLVFVLICVAVPSLYWLLPLVTDKQLSGSLVAALTLALIAIYHGVRLIKRETLLQLLQRESEENKAELLRHASSIKANE